MINHNYLTACKIAFPCLFESISNAVSDCSATSMHSIDWSWKTQQQKPHIKQIQYIELKYASDSLNTYEDSDFLFTFSKKAGIASTTTIVDLGRLSIR